MAVGEFVTPLSLQYLEKASNIENAQPDPNQTLNAVQAGTQVSNAIGAGLKQHDENVKAREFEKILATGIEGMKAFKQKIADEGGDVTGIPDPMLYSKDASQVEAWWKIALYNVGRKKVAKATTSEEAARIGTETGVAPATGYQETLLKKEESQAKIDAEKARKEGVTGLQKEVFGDIEKQPIPSMGEMSRLALSKRIADLRTGVRKVQASTYVAEPESKQISINADKEISDLEGELYRRNSADRISLSMAGLNSKKIDQALKVMDKTEEARVIGKHLGNVDVALKDLGIKEGINTKGKITQNIAGVGIGGQWTKKIIDDPQNARLKQSMEFLNNALRHKSFGATLTGNEKVAYDELSGTGFISSPELFFAAIQEMNDETNEILRMQDIDPEIKKIIEGTGAVTKESTPNENPKKTKLSAAERTALLNKMSDKQLDDYNAGKIDIYGKPK